MKAVTWQGRKNVTVESVPDPIIQKPNDAIIEVTASGLCGSDLHLYDPLSPFMQAGDVMGHEPLGIVVDKGESVTNLKIGDRVAIPFQIACGSCFMCDRGLQTQCETTQVRDQGTGAALFGYTSLYGGIPGAQAEYLRVPHADYGPIKIESDLPDDHFVYLSDVAPTAWQGVEYASVGVDDTLVILGLGPIGEMAARIALMRGIRVIGVDLVDDRLARSASLGVEVIDLRTTDVVEAVMAATHGRGADAVLDAVGMEAHGSPIAETTQKFAGFLPDMLTRPVMEKVGVDRLAALNLAIAMVRRGGTISLSGVYVGMMDPIAMNVLFDKQVRVHMGQANVKRWMDDLLPLAQSSDDPLGFKDFATHHLPLDEAPDAYAMFRDKAQGAIKVIFRP